MDMQTCQVILRKAEQRRKEANAALPSYGDAVQNVANTQLRADAFSDIKNLALLSLGVGAAGRGVMGLANLLKPKKPKPTSGPVLLPLPYPAEAKTAGAFGDFFAGSDASTKLGIPWYAPAMMTASMAGFGAGWKGIDSVLDKQRRQEMDERLNKARQQFHDALLGQYEQPLTPPGQKAAQASNEMREVGQALDRLWEKLAAVLGNEKLAIDLSNVAGVGAGLYGAGAGLAALLSGSFVYDRMAKRSRRAILEKALKRKQRADFQKSPTQIYAIPEPVVAPPPPLNPEELQGPVGEV